MNPETTSIMSDTATRRIDYAPAGDLFADLRRLKVWTQAGVYATIVGYAVVYHFLLHLSTAQFLAVTATVFLLAFCAIEGAFASAYKARRRIIYPKRPRRRDGRRRQRQRGGRARP